MIIASTEDNLRSGKEQVKRLARHPWKKKALGHQGLHKLKKFSRQEEKRGNTGSKPKRNSKTRTTRNGSKTEGCPDEDTRSMNPVRNPVRRELYYSSTREKMSEPTLKNTNHYGNTGNMDPGAHARRGRGTEQSTTGGKHNSSWGIGWKNRLEGGGQIETQGQGRLKSVKEQRRQVRTRTQGVKEERTSEERSPGTEEEQVNRVGTRKQVWEESPDEGKRTDQEARKENSGLRVMPMLHVLRTWIFVDQNAKMATKQPAAVHHMRST